MKFPSFSRLFGADWRARPSRRKARRAAAEQAGRARPARLTLEGLEDRTLMAVLPTPVVVTSQTGLPTVVTSTADKGVNPVVVQDPVNPQKLVTVFTYTNSLPSPANPKTLVEGAFSINDGASWSLFAMPGNRGDPNTADGAGRPFPFSQSTDASVAMDRNENVYIVYSQHDDTNNSGILILQKFTFTTNAGPTQTGAGAVSNNVLTRYLNGEQDLNPVVGVDNNVPSFSDTAPDGTTRTQTDTMVGKAVYVGFNVFTPAPLSPGDIATGANFNPNTIKVIASSDGGATFTTQQYLNDGLPGPVIAGGVRRLDPNYDGTTGPVHQYSAPQILFTQATADGRVKGGQLVFVWNDFGANNIVSDTSQPDNGVLATPVATPAVFTDNNPNGFSQPPGTPPPPIRTGHNVLDAIASNGTPPNIPVTTSFTQTLTSIDPNFTTVGDLDVGMSFFGDHLNEIQITLTAVDAQGRTLGTFAVGSNGMVTLLQNRVGADGKAPTIPPPAVGLPDIAGLGGVVISPPNNLIWHPAEAVFDQQAARAINDPGLTASAGSPFIGHFRPEDDSTIFGGSPNLNGGPSGIEGLNAYSGLTRTQLLNSTWTLSFTDFVSEGNNPPPQFLDFWSLKFSSNISTTGFGTDVKVASPFGDKPLPAEIPGAKAAPFPTVSPSSTIGIPATVSIAQDKTLGAFSPFQGRIYLAYSSQGPGFGGGSAGTGFVDNSNITLVASDNGGKTWTGISYTDPATLRTAHDVTVNNDNALDGFSEGSRPQFVPTLAVDQVTGTLVAAFYDARYDAARARVATYIATSIDGGQTFGPETFVNTPKTAINAVAAAATGINASSTVTLEPVPGNMGASGDPLGFGTHLGLVVNAGHVVPVWSGNVNSAGDLLFDAQVTIAAGPRIVAGDQGPVVQDFSAAGVTYNNTFALDGTRRLGGFVVTFDRPVDATTFTTGQVQVFYHDTTTPAGGGNVPMTVVSVTPLDATTTFGPNNVGGLDLNRQPTLATQFLVRIIDPNTGLAPSRIGTYSYSVGPTIRDRIRSGANGVDNSGPPVNQNSTDTPQPITTAPQPTTLSDVITVVGVPGAFQVSKATVSVNITYPNVEDLRLSLIAPDGTRILLARENTVFGSNFGDAGNDTTFDDAAPTPLTAGAPPFDGSFVPAQPLSGLIGANPNGNWTLEIVDTFTGALTTGTLNHWSLHLKTGVPGGTTAPGNFMDMNQNARTGEPATATSLGDEFVVPTPLPGSGPFTLPYNPTTLPLIIPGPHLATGTATDAAGNPVTVTGTFVNGQPVTPDNLVLNGVTNSIDIVFDRNMNPATVTTANLLRMFGPTGMVSGNFTVAPDPNPGFFRLLGDSYTAGADPDTNHPRTYRITFPQQNLSGTYTLTFSPSMTDVNGNAVDSNLNAGLDVLRGNSQTSPTTIAVTSLTLAGTTAQAVTAAAHGFVTGEEIVIAGANQAQYNGTFTITVTSPTTFTYQVTGSPASPATGTITATRPFTVLHVYDSNDAKTKGNTPVAILPGRRAVAQITVPDDFAIQAATLQLNIQDLSNVSGDALDPHLTATLVGPDGTTVRLFTNVGDTRKPGGFQNTLFDDNAATPIQAGIPPFNQGAFNPQTPLSAFVGKGSAGTYTLFIDDNSTNANIKGTLTDWSLNLTQPTVFSGLGEPVADQFTASFRIFTELPTNPQSRNQWTAVGPAAENAPGEGLNGQNSGRIGGLAVDPSDPSGNTVYVGGASGGIWKTTNFLTTSATGPTYVPLTDFGPTLSLNMGSIALFPRNNDPTKTMIFAITGEGDTGSPGVGILRSMDAGATWQVLDSTSNTTDPHVGQGTLTGIASPLRDHMFVNNNGFQITVDPTLSPDGQVIVYAAMSGAHGGIWISRDSGMHWGVLQKDTNPGPEFGQLETTGAANIVGNATSVALSAGSASAGSHLLQGVFAGVQGVGVFFSQNGGLTFTQTAPVGEPFQGNNLIRNGDFSNPPALTVGAPSANPNGAKGRIALVTPFATGNALQDFLLQGWVYAVVVTTSGHLDGLYESKDFGGNWTKVLLPEFQFGTVGNPPQVAFGVPSNNETLTTQADPLGSTKFAQGNYDVSLAIDPINPNVVYIGGTEDGQIGVQGGLIRVDDTAVFDAKAFVAYDNSNNDGGLIQKSTVGAVNVIRPGGSIGIYEPTGVTNQNVLNFERDPNQPFNVQNSTILVTNGTNFVNDGSGAIWTPFNFDDLLQGSTDQHRVVTMKDPITGQARIIFGDDQGVFTGVDQGNGTLLESVGAVSDLSSSAGNVPIVTGSRNGNLQIAQFYYGASQPSNLAAQIAGAQFYGMAQDDGFPQSDGNILSNGNLNWVGPTGDGTGVATDQLGSGTAYFYKWPCCLNGEGANGSFGPTDFFQVNLPGVGLVSRTGGNGSNLVRGGDDPGNNVGEWPFVNVGQPDGRVIGNFAVNPIDANAMVITSLTGRVFRTTDQGKNWFVIGGGSTDTSVDLDGTYAPAMAFGAPDPNAAPGNLDNFIYAGTEGGHIFVTFSGGGFSGSTKWKDVSGGTLGTAGALDGSGVQDIVTDPRRGSHDLYAVTLRGVYYMADSSVANPTWQNITGNVFNITFNPFGDPSLRQTQLKYLTSIAVDWRFSIPNNFNNPTGPAHPVIYVGGEGGVYRSVAQGGNTWTAFPSTADGANVDGGMLANAHITSLTIETGNLDPANAVPNQSQGPDILMANTYGRGQFAIRLPVNGQLQNDGSILRSPYLTSGQGPRVVNMVPNGAAGVVQGVTSITLAGTTATVKTAAPNGFSTGQQVLIAGANQVQYNGIATITVTSSTTFTYQVFGNPASPATGTTITATALDVNSVTVTFNGPIDPLSIQTPDPLAGIAGAPPASVATLMGPGNTPIAIISIVDVTPTPPVGQPNLHNVYQINFADQADTQVGGVYVLTISTTVTDLAGDYMDQNQDGVNNEPGVDTFTGNFFLSTRAPDPSTHPTPAVPGVVALITQSSSPQTAPVNGLMVLKPTPATATGFTATLGTLAQPQAPPLPGLVLPPLAPGDSYVDGLSGDFTGDGKTDYAVRDLNTGVWYVAVNNGSGFSVSQWGSWGSASFLSWADVRAGYFLGHNRPEAIAGRAIIRNADGSIAAENWFIAQSDGTKFTSNFAGSWGTENGYKWADVLVGDFNGDGFDDIVGRISAPGVGFDNEEFISYSDRAGGWVGKTAFFAGQWQLNGSPNFAVVDIRAGDFNGDGKTDLVGRFRDYGYVFVMQSTGNTGASNITFTPHYWQTWSTAVTWTDVLVGDFDGAGRAELVERVAQNGAVFTSLDFDSARNYLANPDGQHFWEQWSTAVTWVDTQVLDLNGDGQSDLVSRVAENGNWFVAFADPTAKNKFQPQQFAANWTTTATYVNTQSLYQI